METSDCCWSVANCVWLFPIPWTAGRQSSLPFTVSGVCSNSHPRLSRWCYLTISSSTSFFSFCPQSFPASLTCPRSWFFASGGQSIGASALASVLPMNIQGWFPLGLTGLFSLQSKWLWPVFSSNTTKKHQFSGIQPSLWYSSHIHTWLMGNHSFDYMTFVGKATSLLSNLLSRFVMAFLPKSKRLLISWPQSPFTVILKPKKIKSVTASTFSPSICH